MITNNWRNGFGNDGHTDIMVHSNNAISGGKSFTDSSSFDRAMSIKIGGVDSNTQHSTVQKNLGLSSILFSHPVPACANADLWSNTATSINSQDYCFDAWVYSQSDVAGPYVDYFYIGYVNLDKGNPLNDSIVLQFDNTSQRIDYIIYNNASGLNLYNNVKAYDMGQWNHFAINRKGRWFYVFVNGILIGSYDNGSVYDFSYITNPAHMIYYSSGDCSVTRKFYVEEWRHSIGSYRWDRNFTPPNRFY